MPVDTSMYQPQQGQDAMSRASNMLGVLGAINQNKLFQQQYNANMAAGQAAKEAVDPATGMIDSAKYGNALANGPAAYRLPEFMLQNQQMKSGQLDIDTKQLDLANKHLTSMGNYYSGLLAKQGPLTQKDVLDATGKMVSEGLVTPQMAAQELQNLPQDDAGIRNMLSQMMLRTMDGQAKIQAMYGTPQMVQRGGSQVPIMMSPLGGTRQIGPEIPNTLPPSTQVFNPQSNQMEFLGGGLGGLQQPGGMLGGAFGGPKQTPRFGGGPNSDGSMSFAGGAGGLAAAPPLGAAEAASVTGQESAKQGINLQNMADLVPQRKSALSQMENALNKFDPGPTSEWTKNVKALAGRYGLTGDETKRGVASQEEFTKLGTQIALQQLQMLGSDGTNDKLGAAIQANPSTALSKMGNKQIIALLKGNEDALAVKNQAWQQWQKQYGPQSYGQFSTEFNKNYSPTVFQSVYMSPKERSDMINSMSKEEQKQFLSNYRNAINNGWVKLPE